MVMHEILQGDCYTLLYVALGKFRPKFSVPTHTKNFDPAQSGIKVKSFARALLVRYKSKNSSYFSQI